MKFSIAHRINGWLACAVIAAGLTLPTEAQSDNTGPQRIRSHKHLRQLLKERQPRYYSKYRTGLAALADAATQNGPPASPAYSSTLVQVEGVDEADIVKNNGGTIFQINQGRVLVIHAFPADELRVDAVLDFTDGSFYPQQLYLRGNTLAVIGSSFRYPATANAGFAPHWYFSTSTIKAVLYDVTDTANPAKLREVEIDGDLVGSRRVGPHVYLVGRRYPNIYVLGPKAKAKAQTLLPSFTDTASGDRARTLDVRNLFYFPGFDDPVYLIVASFNMDDPASPLNMNAYLGAGDQMFASQQNLYVTTSRRMDIFILRPTTLGSGPAVEGDLPTGAAAAALTAEAEPVDPVEPDAPVPVSQERTEIFKFALTDGTATFVASGAVTGSILNQYSMDEHDGHFRVATTEHAWWGGWDSDAVDRNHVYVLGPNLQLVGKVEDIAPGERIYSARFLGDRAFLVTFENIDPLFAIDLSDPANPDVVGELTLPGVSHFLLPYDENHLIGIGKDAWVADEPSGGDVPWWGGRAFFQGVKLALFDVTDLENPTLMFSEIIGDRGTDSTALWDPHALLFDRSRNLLAFPITVAETPDGSEPWAWGEYVFQGAHVYDVTLENGFELRGAVSHTPEDEDVWFWWNHSIERLLFIDDGLYTLSNAMVKVNDLETLDEEATLDLPQPSYDGGGVIVPLAQ